MYRILLVTERKETIAAFSQIEWGGMGFKPCTIVCNKEAAFDFLRTHHLDAISFDLPEEEDKALTRFLVNEFPNLPVFPAVNKPDEAIEVIRTLRVLLNRLNSDYSNDGYSKADIMQQCRHEYFRQLLGGEIRDASNASRTLRMLRSRMDQTQKCMVMHLSMPDGDHFLSDRWRYGHERLEVAIRNFLGAEMEGIRMLVSVLPDEEIYLLCCPMIEAEVNLDAMNGSLLEHTRDALIHISSFLGLSLVVDDVVMLNSVLDLAVRRQ